MSRKGASGGYHGDLSIPGYKPKTPTVAPPKKWAAKGPAGTYAGAAKEYEAAVTALPPAAESVTRAATREATKKRRRRQERRQKAALKLTKPKPLKRAEKKAPESYEAPKLSDLGKPLGDAVQAIEKGVEAAVEAKDKAVVAAVKLPEKKVTKAFGKPTLGTPKVKELVKAKKEGRLSGVRRGRVVATPQARRAKKQLKRARKVYAKKARPNIEGLPSEDQERFAEAFSKASGLPPKLAGDWSLREGGGWGSDGVSGGEAGEQNWLGIGYPGEQTAMSRSGYFNNVTPEEAGKNAARWIRGEIGGEYSYKAAPSIQGIDDLVKSGASDPEIRAYIAGPSAWGTGEIPNSPQVTASPGKAGPKVTRRLKKAEKRAKKLGIKGPTGKPTVASAPIPAKKRKGEWAGTKDILLKAATGIEISSEKRTPGENAAVGGSPSSDHLTTNENTFATDLPASGASLNQIGSKVAKRLGVSSWTPGNYDWYTSAKYPGYRFQILSEVDGHFDHVHVGAEWTGEDLPKGTVLGGSTGTSSGAVSVGGAAATSYAAATGTSVEQVGKQMKQGKLTPQEIYEKLESLGVGLSSSSDQAESRSTSSVLSELERKYAVR